MSEKISLDSSELKAYLLTLSTNFPYALYLSFAKRTKLILILLTISFY